MAYVRHMREADWSLIRGDVELGFLYCRNEVDLQRAATRMRVRFNYLLLFARSFEWTAEQEFGPQAFLKYARRFKPGVVDISPLRARRRRTTVILDPNERKRANRLSRRNAPNWSEAEFIRLCVGLNRYFNGVDWPKARQDPDLPSLACADDALLDRVLSQAIIDGSLVVHLLTYNCYDTMFDGICEQDNSIYT